MTLLNSVCFTTPNMWSLNATDIVCLSCTYDCSHYERSATNKAHGFLHTNFLLPDADVTTGIVRRLRTFRCISFAGTIFRGYYWRFFRICFGVNKKYLCKFGYGEKCKYTYKWAFNNVYILHSVLNLSNLTGDIYLLFLLDVYQRFVFNHKFNIFEKINQNIFCVVMLEIIHWIDLSCKQTSNTLFLGGQKIWLYKNVDV